MRSGSPDSLAAIMETRTASCSFRPTNISGMILLVILTATLHTMGQLMCVNYHSGNVCKLPQIENNIEN